MLLVSCTKIVGLGCYGFGGSDTKRCGDVTRRSSGDADRNDELKFCCNGGTGAGSAVPDGKLGVWNDRSRLGGIDEDAEEVGLDGVS